MEPIAQQYMDEELRGVGSIRRSEPERERAPARTRWIPWSYFSPAEGISLRGWHCEPSGRPVIHFMHDGGLCCRAYEPLLDRLGERFDLWLCDIQGHGDSDQGGTFLGWESNARLALLAFEEHAHYFGNVDRFAVGHGLGGAVTALMLASDSARFERAIVLNPILLGAHGVLRTKRSCEALTRQVDLMTRAAQDRQESWPSRADAIRGLSRGRGIYRDWSRAATEAFVKHALREVGDGVALKCRPHTHAAYFRTAPGDLWPALTQVSTPVLAICAQSSYSFVLSAVEQWKQLNPCVQSLAIPGGHFYMQERRDCGAAPIESFLLDGS